MTDFLRRSVAEGGATAALVTTIVGSGIMAERLTGDPALALLCNALATGAMLVVLITLFAPLSGAHLNPVVSLVMALKGEVPPLEALGYGVAQIAGGILGTLLAHALFGHALIDLGTHARTGAGQWLSELIATFGLLSTILIARGLQPTALPWLVGLYIAAAYWVTASTSFANPAVTIARALTSTFSGIRPVDAPAFIAAQVAGALLALVVVGWLLAERGGKKRTPF